MGSSFNTQILIDKLMKLNSSQQSIETLSHWCIFHMNNAKQVVETWDRQFHCSPNERRLAFLYLANDIIQNSRRKGAEFVTEFWKVLPDALRYVIEHGDQFGKNAALRLIGIWEERKVFGSRGQILKEEFVKKQLNNENQNGKDIGFKLKPSGNTVDKILSGYQVLYGGQLDEDVILNSCRDATSSIEKIIKDIGNDYRSDHLNQSGISEELKGKHAILRDYIEQLEVIESSRAKLVSLLREALQEQEYKLDQVRNQLQAAQAQSEQASSLYQPAADGKGDGLILAEQSQKETQTSPTSHTIIPGSREQSAPIMYTRSVPFTEKPGQIEEDPKSAAAAVAAKLTASTSSAEMLTYVLSSLASEGVIGNQRKEASGDYSVEKRAKIENEHSSYVPQNPQAPVPPYSHHASTLHNLPVVTQDSNPDESPPPLPTSPPPLAPLPPMQPYPIPQYMPTAAPVPGMPYGYDTGHHPAPVPGYTPVGHPMNGVSPFGVHPPTAYMMYPTEGGVYGQQSSLPSPATTQQ